MNENIQLYNRPLTGSQALLDTALVELDAFRLGRLALTLAAELLYFCDSTEPCVEQAQPSQNPVLRMLEERGLDRVASDTNFLIYKAELLYAIVQADVAAGGRRILWVASEMQSRKAEPNAHRQIIADALAAVQRYKTAVIRRDQEVNGAHWGDATTFNRKDWTNLNEEFLSMRLAGSNE